MARLYTLEDIHEAGRQLVRDNGWRPTEAQAMRIASILRPHLDLASQPTDTTQTAS